MEGIKKKILLSEDFLQDGKLVFQLLSDCHLESYGDGTSVNKSRHIVFFFLRLLNIFLVSLYNSSV